MEVAVWTVILTVLIIVFKSLIVEKENISYNEKQLLKLYFDIKLQNPDNRVFALRDWEVLVLEHFEKTKINSNTKVIQLHSFK